MRLTNVQARLKTASEGLLRCAWSAVLLPGFMAGTPVCAQAPIITTQPQSTISLPGANIMLGAAASGQVPLTYAWRKDGAWLSDGNGISGSFSSNLFINNLQPSNSGTY